MDYMTQFYPESKVGGFTDLDGTILFYARVNSLLTPESTVLDVGCGRGACRDDPVPIRRQLQVLKGRCETVVGIDVDPGAADNPYIDEFRQIEGAQWPVESESVNVCIADWVLEHVEDPRAFFKECARVLAPGGYVCLRTANVRSYVGLISRLIPNSMHAAILGRAQPQRQARDVFPTVYRCNTERKLRGVLRSTGFHHVVYNYASEPSYLSFSRLAYLMGVLHQRYGPKALQDGLFAFARKGQDFGDNGRRAPERMSRAESVVRGHDV